MRTRLLDMGLVGPLRAHSLRLAIAGAVGADGEPAALVACASAGAVTVGQELGDAVRVASELAAGRDLPVVRLPGSGPPTVVGEGALLLTLFVPARAATALGLVDSDQGRRDWWRRLLEEVAVTAGPECAVSAEQVDDCCTFTVSLDYAGEGAAVAAAESPAAAAESVLQHLERHAGLELVPSMPMPLEMEAVYEWERRLAEMALRPSVQPALAPIPQGER